MSTKPKSSAPDNQGEGNQDAAREYNERTQEYVRAGKVQEAARAAEPRNEAERKSMEVAEEEGKRRAKELDPEEQRDYDRPSKPG